VIRLRVSDLDQWLSFLDPPFEEWDYTLDQFLAYMERRAPESPEMQAGKAFHEVLEHAVEGDQIGSIEAGGLRFHFDCDADLVAMPEREGAIIEKVYPTRVGPALLRGRTDARDGLTVVDYKLTFSTFDAERYAESMQWRAYLDMTGRRKFAYQVFKAKWDGDSDIIVQESHLLTFWAYPEMHGDVQQCVEALAEFVQQHVPSLVMEAA
jgi:hypothetical protein